MSERDTSEAHSQWPTVETDGAASDRDLQVAVPITALSLRVGWKTIVSIAAALFLGLGLLGSMWLLSRPLAMLIFGLAIAAALAPPVSWLSRWMPRILAIIVVHMLVVGIVIGLAGLIIPPLVEQAREFNESVPDTIDWLDGRIETLGLQDTRPLVDNAIASLGSSGGQLLSLPMTISDALLDLLVVFFFSIYGMMGLPAVREFLDSLFPDKHRPDFHHVVEEMVEAMGGYLRGVFITGLSVGVITYLGLTIIGVPYAVVLSVLAGVLEVIPVIGTTISLVTITGVALIESASMALVTFGFMAVVQIVEGNILFPNIVGRQTHSSPLLSMFAFFAGMSVGGIVGGIIGVPLAAALRVIVVEVIAPAVRKWTRREEDEPSPAESVG